MDFTLTDEQQAVHDLAERVFTDRATPERVAASGGFDRQLWADLASTGLLGIALAEDHGGSGRGLLEASLVLEQQGRRVAPVPLWPAVCAGLALARFGSADQRARWLPALAGGSSLVTLGLEEWDTADPLRPATVATSASGGWRLSGTKAAVPAAQEADRVLLPAATPEGPRLFLVDPVGAGVTLQRAATTIDEPSAHVVLEDAPGEPVDRGVDGSGASAEGAGRTVGPVGWLVDRARVALAALQLGVAEGALGLAAGHVTHREQFGRPLGTFQAVAHRMADGYIDLAAMRTTLSQAAWRLDEGLDPGTAVTVASWWAADAGDRLVHAVQHLHGGVGVDVSHPLHRYLLWGTQLANTLGGPSAQLARLGSQLRAGPPPDPPPTTAADPEKVSR